MIIRSMQGIRVRFAYGELYPRCRSGDIRLIIKSIIRSMSGFLTRAECRALRMTAENGSYALEFTHLPPHTYDCHAMHILYLFSTLKALRGFGYTAASVPDDFFCYFFSSLEKK